LFGFELSVAEFAFFLFSLFTSYLTSFSSTVNFPIFFNCFKKSSKLLSNWSFNCLILFSSIVFNALSIFATIIEFST
jgi:hypothetical protein